MSDEEIFRLVKLELEEKRLFNDIMGVFLGTKTSNFKGGCGDLRTIHESMFAILYPDLKQQATFGTGKGGYKEYGFKRVIVDFFDSKKKIAYEIDGDNHKQEIQRLKDRLKELFLWLEFGIKTVRLTNSEVEEILFKRICRLNSKNMLDFSSEVE